MTGKEALERAGGRIARRDAEVLLGHVLGRDRAWLLAHPEAELPEGPLGTFDALVKRRAAHEPVQHLTGHQEFFGLDLQVTADVLIPRPETELLVEAALAWIEQRFPDADEPSIPRIVDVGTGTGAIALALASRLPQAEIWAVDLSEAVRPVLESNAERTGLGGCVRFLESDLLSGFADGVAAGRLFDVVVSNPPYVPRRDAETLAPEVREFEPHLALFGGDDGLEVYRRLIPQAWAALGGSGLLALEIGYGQEEDVRGLLDGWADVHVTLDYAGIPRVVTACRP